MLRTALGSAARPIVIDTALAVLLAVAALLELWWGSDRGSAFFTAVALAGTLPLAWRRRFPLAVVVAAAAALSALTIAETDFFTTAQLLAVVVATYTVAASTGRTRALTGLAIATIAGLANSLRLPGREVGDVVFPVLFLAGPWVAGRALRLWRGRTAELERLTRELERQREEGARLAVVAERGRIARELHDALTQSLNITVISAEAAEEALDRDPQRAREPLTRIQRIGREALGETRRMLGVLRTDGEPAGHPGAADLDTLVDRIREAGLGVRLRVEGEPRPLPPALDLSVYRIVQESLTNTLKHAGAGSAEVVLRYGDAALDNDVVDDGCGPGERGGGGHGLLGMRERAALLGGQFSAGGRTGRGFAVHARLPLDGSAR